ncbi:MAG TPA: hypothetical protein VMT79_17650 [Candidatus Binatia bacterium]|jgi:hypothetical protein|nr:hypothetical protein [Candidatus Binatia bacterium]
MRVAERVVACFLLFGALLVWPFLAIPNRPTLVLGIPSLVLYLFAVWGAIVAVLVAVTRGTRSAEDAP